MMTRLTFQPSQPPKAWLLAACAALLLPLTAFGHRVATKASEIIPIPKYAPKGGKANAKVALEAAHDFIRTFDDSQKAKLIFAWDSEERKKWSNLPAKIVKRAGFNFKQMTKNQRELFFVFLASSVGEQGYDRVAKTMAAEGFLSTDPKAERFGWAPENYWVSFYGDVKGAGKWGWQFGGHHLGINMSYDKGKTTSMSPSFLGTEPAFFTYKDVKYHSLVDMHKDGYDLYESLPAEQKKAATYGEIPRDVLTGPGKDGELPPWVGIPAAKLAPKHQAALLELISKWVAVQPDEPYTARMAEIKAELAKTRFAFAGGFGQSVPAYYRIHGPSLIIEMLSLANNVGETAKDLGHYHTMYRNPGKDYGDLGR